MKNPSPIPSSSLHPSRNTVYSKLSHETRGAGSTSSPSLPPKTSLSLSKRMYVKVHQKRSEIAIPKSKPPYVIMRNGIPFLYTPTEIQYYRPNIISPFGSTLRGSMVRGRNDTGNMFAIHSEERLEKPKPLSARSCLNARSKWK